MWKLTAIWIAVQVICFGSGYLMLADGEGFGCFEILGGFFFLGVGIYVMCTAKKTAEDNEIAENMREKAEKLRDAKILDIRQQLHEGKWVFPAESFYRSCRENNILQLDNEFSYVKAQKLAEKCIHETLTNIEEKIDSDTRDSLKSLISMGKEEYVLKRFTVTLSNLDHSEYSKYTQKSSLERYFIDGRKLADFADHQELIRQKTPRTVSPNAEEQIFIRRVNSVSKLNGNQKRVEMLSDLIQDFNGQIERIRQGEEAMKTLGMIYMQQQKKEGDWAVAGGIAEGIAGPVAGFMAASQVMENNRKLQQHNEAMRNTSRNILSGIPSMMSDRMALEREQKETRQQLQNANEKITLSKPNAAEIWNHIQVGRFQIEKAKSGVLHIALPVHIETPFVLDVPDNVKTVVDGTLKAEVRFEDKLVGTVNFPLPLYGIPTNMTTEVTLDGMLDRSVEFNGEYTLKMLDSHNLWIMEA